MGLFSDKCEALIDKATGRALTGPALEQARQEKKWPRCGARVKKKARGCSECGTPAPGGWWKCPACGKWVGNESRYCWNCSQPLYPDERIDLAGGVWRKQPGIFAQRFEVGDVGRLLKEGLQVQEGTAAILLDGGREAGVLGPGRHTPDGVLRKINWFGNPPPRSVVLVDNGDIVVPIRVEGLRSAEEFPLELCAEIILHFNPKRGDDFVANLFKEARTLAYHDLATFFVSEINYVAANICNTSTIEDLVKNPQRRLELESALAENLTTGLERAGMELVRVSYVDFVGDQYEELRVQASELEVTRRKVEFTQKMRELLASEKMHEFKSEAELAEYVTQLAQEREIAALVRDHELARLTQVQRHELESEAADFAMAREMEATAHQIGIKLEWDNYIREKLVEDAKAAAEAYKAKEKSELEIAAEALKLRAEKQRIKHQEMKDRADIMKGRSAREMMALVDDPEQRRMILELEKMEFQKGMSSEQILAVAAAESPAAANALAQMSAAQRDEMRQMLEEQKALFGESRERDERMLLRVTEMMTVAAKRVDAPPSQQIIK